MADDKAGAKAFDPFEPFRGVRDAYLDSMSKAMIEAVNTEGYAQATGAMLDSYLTASAPFREALEKSISQALQQLSLPSRQEIASLAQRFTNVEMRLDDIDAKLDLLARKLAEENHARARTVEQAATPAKQKTASAHAAPHKTARAASAKPRRQKSAGGSQG